MLLQSLSALCKAPGGSGSIWEYLEAVVRATRVSGRFGYSFRTELHFADVSCNIHILAHQQDPHTIRWSMPRPQTCLHFRQANTANRQRCPHVDVIMRMKARADWRQTGSEHWEHCAACNPKRSFRQRKDRKRTCYATTRKINGSRIMGRERPL